METDHRWTQSNMVWPAPDCVIDVSIPSAHSSDCFFYLSQTPKWTWSEQGDDEEEEEEGRKKKGKGLKAIGGGREEAAAARG